MQATLRVKNTSWERGKILWNLPPGARPGSHSKYWGGRGGIPSCFRQEKRNYFEICQTALLFSKRPALRGNQLTSTYPAGVLSEHNWSGEGKCPTPAHSSRLVPPKGEEKNWETLSKLTVQRHRLTAKLKPNQRTIECFPSPHTLQLHFYSLIYCSYFYPVHHSHLSGNNYKAY